MQEEKGIRFDYEDSYKSVLWSNSIDSIFDFVNQLPDQFKKDIFSMLDNGLHHGAFSIKINDPLYLFFYKNGSIENTIMFLFEDVDDLIRLFKKKPLHSTDNQKIIKLVQELKNK